LKLINIDGVKTSGNKKALVKWGPKPSDLAMGSLRPLKRGGGRNEPVIVAKISEDLWLGVKSQSNLEIAGFLRKLLK